MKKIITVIGARPQIIKASALSRAIKNNFSEQLQEVIVHTGQHYDENMSAIFFKELGIPQPDYNLKIGSASHGQQSADMISGLEELFIKEKPNAIVVYGDTNSTLAAAVAGSKLNIPIIHVEAGLRSFNKSMPEEINRILCDHVSTLLFSPTMAGVTHLKNEGFKNKNNPPYSADSPKVYHCGDIMYDNSLHFAKLASEENTLLDDIDLKGKNYVLATVHRGENTDNVKKLKAIFDSFIELLETNPGLHLVLPLHPRTKNAIETHFSGDFLNELELENNRLHIIPPVSFLDMIALEKNCQLVITDSGGVQKEAYFFHKPSVILRKETEWVEIIENKCAVLVGAEKDAILKGVNTFLTGGDIDYPQLFGDGRSALFIANEILSHC